jgi:hypothetical protein
MQWIEALINISALAGFIGVANLGHQTLAVKYSDAVQPKTPKGRTIH